jgi:NitT/TauT family transport system substrate-binding protein
LSIVLKQQGEDIKIVYIGNRHESTFVTRKDLNIQSLKDLEGKTIAVPIRYSGHNLAVRRLLAEKAPLMDVNIVEMNPPDMAAALGAGSLDGYFVGEPFAAKTLFAGKSQRFYYAEEIWNGFICNLLIVRQHLINTEPNAVKALVTGSIRAGLWAKEHQDDAADIAAKYWNQPVDLVKYAMNTPANRILFDRFVPKDKEMQEIADLMLRFGLTESSEIKGLVDASFAEKADVHGITNLRSILPH